MPNDPLVVQIEIPTLYGGTLQIFDLSAVHLEIHRGIREVTDWHTFDDQCWCIQWTHDRCNATNRYYEEDPDADEYKINEERVSREAYEIIWRKYGELHGYTYP